MTADLFHRTPAMTVGAVLLGSEAVAAVAVGFVSLAQLFTGRVENSAMLIVLALFAFALGVALAFSARAIWHLRRTLRSFAVTWQLVQLVIAVQLLSGAQETIGVLMIALSIVVIFALAAPSTTLLLRSVEEHGSNQSE